MKVVIINILILVSCFRECREKLDYYSSFDLKNPVAVDGFELQCDSTPKCCSELEIAEKVHSQAENVRYQVRQQANATTAIIAETRRIFHDMINKAQGETVEQVKQGYPTQANLIMPLINDFYTALGRMLSDNRYNQIVAELEFDKFLSHLTRKYVEQISKTDVDVSAERIDRFFSHEECLDQLNQQKEVTFTKERIRKSFQPVQLILWTIEQLRKFQFELTIDDFKPTAKCVAPLLYCAPCENKKQLIDSDMCFDYFDNGTGQTCFTWLDKWSETIEELQKDIDSYQKEEQYYIQLIFDQLPTELGKTIQTVLTETGPEAFDAIKKNRQCESTSSSSGSSFHRERRLAPRLTDANDFSAHLGKVITSANRLKKAVISSVCVGLSEPAQSDSQATHVMPHVTKIIGRDIIEEKLNHIQSQLRRRRDDAHHELREHHHQKTDFEGSADSSSGCDDEDLCTDLTDQSTGVVRSENKEVRLNNPTNSNTILSTLSTSLVLCLFML